MNIQVAFGTIGMTLSPEQFNELIVTARELYNANRHASFPDRKQLAVPTVSKSVNIMCSVNELAQLNHLLQQGRNNIEMAKLVVFNEN